MGRGGNVQELNYNYDEETVEALHDRALGIYGRLNDKLDIHPEIRASVYNSILNMVAQVQVGNIVVPGLNSDLTKRKH